jgi:hypothetical protein
MKNFKDQEMYILFSPDGFPQLSTLALTFAECIAWVTMIGESGIAAPINQLLESGFKIIPVIVSITVTGTQEDGYKKAKEKL